jgi:sugar phosphate isomerase/epimerase
MQSSARKQKPFAVQTRQSRRKFIASAVKAGAVAAFLGSPPAQGQPSSTLNRRMKICLTPGSIGVSTNQAGAVELAARHGFEAVEPYGTQFAALTDVQRDEVVASLREKNLVWGAAGLPVEFRQDESRFNDGLKGLPPVAAALAKAGADRVGTWLSPAHNSLTYLQHFRQCSQRLREVARVLKDHNLRFGLEYVGTITSRSSRKHPFIHTLAETRELIAEIGTGNVGVILDSWHWWQAADTIGDILSLKNADIVSVDLNDAPAGLPKEQQRDGQRELPCATGVIDVAAFLNALVQVGYDGPVRAEPFNKPLNDLDNEAACAATIRAMRKAFELIR